ncbi:MAG: LptF/LptG family permease [Abditibacteriota bacterium]|nr:LptF/LptG family permease [Abditibacteriota bacterium]
MKISDRMLFRELLGPFLFGVAAFSMLFFAGDFLQDVSQLISEGLPLATAGLMILYYMPTVIFYTLPMATLLAVIYSIGRFSGESEMISCFAAGIGYRRLLVPVIAFVLMAAGISYCLNDYVAPASYMRLQALEAEAKKNAVPDTRAVMFYDKGTRSIVRADGGFDISRGVAADVTIIRFDGGAPSLVIYAKKAVWQGMTDKSRRFDWELYDGYTQKLGDDFGARVLFGSTRTDTVRIEKDVEELELLQKAEMHNSVSNMSFFELRKLVRLYKTQPDAPERDIRKAGVFMWNRLALPMSCIILGLIAAPLAIRSHRSSAGVGIGISLLVIGLYYIVWNYGSQLAYDGTLTPFAGSFGANILGLGAALYFNLRVKM